MRSRLRRVYRPPFDTVATAELELSRFGLLHARSVFPVGDLNNSLTGVLMMYNVCCQLKGRWF